MVEGWRLKKRIIIIRTAGLPAFKGPAASSAAPSPDSRNMTCQVLSSSWSIAPASQLARSQQGLGSKAALVLQPLPAQVFKQLQAAPARPRGLRTSTAVSLHWAVLVLLGFWHYGAYQRRVGSRVLAAKVHLAS